MILITMYARKMKSTACEKCWPRITVTVSAISAAATKVILVHLTSAAESFLNFMENIGISLTSRIDNIADDAGIIHVLSVKTPTILFMSRCAMTANEPQIIAHAGVARPRKFSLCLSSILNFASLMAENTTMIRGI